MPAELALVERVQVEVVVSEKIAGDFTPDRDRVADADAEVPVIDISKFSSGGEETRAAIVNKVRDACERIGFLVITGHGVPEDTIERTFKVARTFFARPADEKQRIKRPGPGISRGYNGVASQSLARTLGNVTPPDLMESLGFGPPEIGDGPYWREGYGPTHFHPNLWPDDMPEFREAVSDYWRAMEGLLDTADACLCARARPRRKLFRQPQRPSRHQHAHQLLSGAAERPREKSA